MAKGSVMAMSADKEWQIESDLRTLMEAEKIEKDEKRFKAAKELAKKRLLDLASVASETD